MKKFLVVLLSLGLIAAFAAPASAATTMSFAGEYYVWGVYHDNARLAGDNARMSLSYLQTQTRIKTAFNIAPGLTFTMRFDALEKLWGNTNWKGGTTDSPNSRPASSVTTNGAATGTALAPAVASSEPKIQESFEMELGWVSFDTAIGTFDVGYQTGQGGFGTKYIDGPQTNPRIALTNKMGPLTLQVAWDKIFDPQLINDPLYLGKVDADNDFYTIQGIYKQGPMEAGLRYRYIDARANRYKGTAQKYSIVNPYAKATFGPVYVEGEFGYQFGKQQVAEMPATNLAQVMTVDKDFESYGGYLSATLTLGPAKVGALYAYTQGNNYEDANKTQSAISGHSWMPQMILFNNDINGMEGDTMVTNNGGAGGNNPGKAKRNTSVYGVFGSYKVTPKLDLAAAFSYLTVNNKKFSAAAGNEAVSDKLGMEFDMTANYKLYDNLTYMIGGGYVWTGDWWKGVNPNAVVGNDYLLMNRLTLSF